MKTRDSWHKKARKTNDNLHWNAFRFFRQEVKREIRIAEKEYVRSELLKSNGNTNSIWKIINHCLPNREPPLTTVEDPVVQANRFNDFYISVGQTAAIRQSALQRKLCHSQILEIGIWQFCFLFNPTYFIYENLKQTAEKKISNCAVVIILRSSLSDHALQC